MQERVRVTKEIYFLLLTPWTLKTNRSRPLLEGGHVRQKHVRKNDLVTSRSARSHPPTTHYPGMFHLSEIPMQIAFCKVGWGGGRGRGRRRESKAAEAIVTIPL